MGEWDSSIGVDGFELSMGVESVDGPLPPMGIADKEFESSCVNISENKKMSLIRKISELCKQARNKEKMQPIHLKQSSEKRQKINQKYHFLLLILLLKLF